MIRLPKATKTPLKTKLVPRPSLANIVKDLGKDTKITPPLHQLYPFLLKHHWILLCALGSHHSPSETEGIQRTPNTHQQEPGQPASCGPEPAREERLWQRQCSCHTHHKLYTSLLADRLFIPRLFYMCCQENLVALLCSPQSTICLSLIGSQASGVPYPANGRPYTSGMRTTSQSVIKRQKVSQGEAPNPVVFVATKDTRYMKVTVIRM